MAEMYAVSGETLKGIADAIRTKTGSDEPMTVASMASAIEGISGGGLPDGWNIWIPDTRYGAANSSTEFLRPFLKAEEVTFFFTPDIARLPNGDVLTNQCFAAKATLVNDGTISSIGCRTSGESIVFQTYQIGSSANMFFDPSCRYFYGTFK